VPVDLEKVLKNIGKGLIFHTQLEVDKTVPLNVYTTNGGTCEDVKYEKNESSTIICQKKISNFRLIIMKLGQNYCSCLLF
jgi:hypothetical protein